MDKKNYYVNGNIIKFICTEKDRTDFKIRFNGMECDDYALERYYAEQKAKGELIEVLPSIYYQEIRILQEESCDNWYDRCQSTDNIAKKIVFAILAIITKVLFNKQRVTKVLDVRNKRDVISVFNGSCKNKENIFNSSGSKKKYEIITDRLDSEYDSKTEHKFVDPRKILYPTTLGSGAGKCIIWDIFEESGLMSTFDPLYRIFTTREMFEASSHNSSLLAECEKFEPCKRLLEKFRNGTYETDSSKNTFCFDDIELSEYKGVFFPEEGKHRVCIAKRFNIERIYASVYKAVNIRKKSSERHSYICLPRERHHDVGAVLKDCYKRFENLGLNRQHVQYILENGLSDVELINYIEKNTGKSIKSIAKEIRKNTASVF